MGEDEVLRVVLAAAEEVFGTEAGAGANFFELGGDSVLAAALLAELEDRLERPVDWEVVVDAESFAALARSLAGESAGEPAGELVGEPAGELVGEPAGELVGEPAGELVGEPAGARGALR